MAGALIAVLLVTLVYLSSARFTELRTTLNDLHSLQEYKSHVQAPQKDMNQFIGAIDKTVLLLELGQAKEAQEAYQGTVDAEQDISGEFEYLEKNAPEALKADAAKAHTAWESATEFQKLYAERVADERKVALVRPATEPTKVVDAHTREGADAVVAGHGSLTSAKLQEVANDRDVSPVEAADVLIDGLEETTDGLLDAEKKAGENSLKSATQTILFGSGGVFLAVLLVGLVTGNSISRPLLKLKDGAEQIADGRLDYAFDAVSPDEVGSVVRSVQKMCGSLKERIGTLEEVAGVVLITGDEIADAAAAIEPKTPEVQAIAEKAETLKGLVGQVLEKTHL